MHLGHLLTRAAQRYPNRPAWLQGDLTITFREAEERVNRLANGLLDLGLRPGDRVGFLVNNCYQGLEAILAPMMVGMAALPMNARLHPTEHQYLLESSGASALIFGQEFRDHVAALGDSLPKVKHYVCIGDALEGEHSFESMIASALPTAPAVTIQPGDLAWVFFTSGTTGRPKGAMLSHRSLLAMTSALLTDVNPVVPTDVLLHAAPITHGSGLSMFHHIARCAANAFPDTYRFDPPKIFASIQRHRATTMLLVPTMVKMLLASESKTEYDLSSLHTVLYSGSPMYTEHLLEAVRTFGNIFVQIYGQGEAPNIVALPKEEHVLDGDASQSVISAGRELGGVNVRIFDADDRVLPPGETGEIVVRGDQVMTGYLNNPEATAETLRGGWLHTGDMGYLDCEGYLYITDRKSDMIISGGANIYPREVEEVIVRHPSVAEVAVIGVPDPLWGESVKAMVVLQPNAKSDAEAIIGFCRENLASYKKPRSVDFLPSLSKNAYGKVEKQELRAPYWAGQGRNM